MSGENNARRGWKDWSNGRRALAVVQMLLQMGLLVAALVDLSKRPKEAINGDKRRWYGIVFVSYVGPIAYFVFGRKKEAELLEEGAQSA